MSVFWVEFRFQWNSGIIINQLLSPKKIQHKIMLENVVRNFYHRVLKCIDESGQHFQDLLGF
jgi:hypothetical protein